MGFAGNDLTMEHVKSKEVQEALDIARSKALVLTMSSRSIAASFADIPKDINGGIWEACSVIISAEREFKSFANAMEWETEDTVQILGKISSHNIWDVDRPRGV